MQMVDINVPVIVEIDEVTCNVLPLPEVTVLVTGLVIKVV